MKRTFLYLLLAAAVFTSCRKDDTVFDQSPDERLNETLEKYESALINAPNGWNAAIIPGNGAIYNFFFRFDNKNRVRMFSDFDTATAGNAMESSYRLKALQQPSLLFDTYSYIHLLADPDPSVNGGFPAGQGLISDFEFAIDSVTANRIWLTGRQKGTQMVLTRATQQEAAAWENKAWARSLSLQNIDDIPVYFKRLTVGGRQYDVQLDQFSRTLTFFYVDNTGAIKSFTTSFSYSPNGITLVQPFNDGTNTITGFSNLNWNAGTAVLNLTVNNTPATIRGEIAPVKVDVNAPRRWWNYAADRGTYWAAIGFSVNGVFDAYRVTSVANFMVYWPEIGTTSGGVTLDLLGFVLNNAINYGPAFQPPTFTADGRIVFTHFTTLGTVPANATTVVNNTIAKMTEPEGFYLVQLGPTLYDMVSAKDARSWITWVR